MKYVVTKGMLREEIRPFGGCYLVVKETNSFVWIINKYDKEEKIGKVNVWFFTDRDVSESIKILSNSVNSKYEEHLRYVARIIQEAKDNYAVTL